MCTSATDNDEGTTIADFIKDKIGNANKLIRDNALQDFSQNVHDWDEEKIKSLENQLIERLAVDDKSDNVKYWTVKHGCLCALKILVDSKKSTSATTTNTTTGDQSWRDALLRSNWSKLLEHDENRVRLAAGEFLGSLCACYGTDVYKFCRDDVIALIEQNLECDADVSSYDPKSIQGYGFSPRPSSNSAINANIDQKLRELHTANVTKLLESSVKTLQWLIENCGPNFTPYTTSTLMVLVLKLVDFQSNTFVRESAINILGYITALQYQEGENSNNPIIKHADTIADRLESGLTDIQDHVRFAACSAVGKFLPNFPNNKIAQEKYYPQLLPPLCLNRYCLADGVRLQAQNAWRSIVQENGLDFVAKFFDKVAEQYVKQLKSTCYVIRQAANHATMELMRKFNPDTIKPHLFTLYNAILDQLNDECWQVRDSACLACGEIFATFPDDCRPLIGRTFEKLSENLGHFSPLVRSASAQSLAKMADVYGCKEISLIPKLKSGLSFTPIKAVIAEMTRQQPGGVKFPIKSAKFAKDVPNYNAFMWKVADGCIQLVFELAAYPKLAPTVAQMVPNVVEALQKRDYPEHFIPLEAALNRMSGLAKNLGKNRFKSILDDFIEVIFYALTCDCPHVQQSAKICLQDLSTFIGYNIFKAKIQRINVRYVDQFESALRGIKE